MYYKVYNDFIVVLYLCGRKYMIDDHTYHLINRGDNNYSIFTSSAAEKSCYLRHSHHHQM